MPTDDKPPSYEVDTDVPGARGAVWHADQATSYLRVISLENGPVAFSVGRCGMESRVSLTFAQRQEMIRFLENTDVPSREPDDDMDMGDRDLG